METRRKNTLCFKLLLFKILVFITSAVVAQDLSFKENELIDIGAGQQFKILRCRHEGAKQECEVMHYVNVRQQGNSFWLLAKNINEGVRAGKFMDRKMELAETGKAPKTSIKKSFTNQPGVTDKKTGLHNSVVLAVNNYLKAGLPAPDTLAIPKVRDSSMVNQEKQERDTIITIMKDSIKKRADTFQKETTQAIPVVTPTEPLVSADSVTAKKLSVFIDCSNTSCDMNYIRTNITIVDFLLDRTAADVHVLINQQRTGSGGSSIQMIFYGQQKFAGIHDTLTVNVEPNSTDFESRAEMLQGIKAGILPFLLKTPYAKYIEVNLNPVQQKSLQPISVTKDVWNYWVFTIGGSGTFNSGQVYKSTEASSYIIAGRTTDKLKVSFSGSNNYNFYKYSYNDNVTSYEYEILNRYFLIQHSLIASLGSHWGMGYQVAYSKSTFSNNKSRLYGKTAVEYSIFPYKDVNTRLFTISYGLDVRANNYYETTIYFLKDEILVGQMAQADLAFNQKWGTFSSTIAYSNYFKDASLNNLSASLKLYFRITGGLSFNIYANGSRVRDQVYLVKGSANIQDVLTRRRQLGSEYNFSSGVGLIFRFGSKLNNFVNRRMDNL